MIAKAVETLPLYTENITLENQPLLSQRLWLTQMALQVGNQQAKEEGGAGGPLLAGNPLPQLELPQTFQQQLQSHQQLRKLLSCRSAASPAA